MSSISSKNASASKPSSNASGSQAGTEDGEKVVRVRTRATLAVPEVARLIMDGAAACKLPRASEILVELDQTIGRDDVGCFIGFAAYTAVCVVIVLLPTSVFHPAPFVVVFYGDASQTLREAIAARIRSFVTLAGYSETWALNWLHTDRSLLRRFAYFGAGERFASVLRFRWRGPDE